MIGIFFTWLATALSLMVVDILLKGVDIGNSLEAILAAIALGAVNASVKPILSTLTLPLNFLSLGAASLVVNGLCFWLASLFVPGFHVSGLLAFILGPVILSFVNTLLSRYIAERRPDLKLDSSSGLKAE